MFDGRARMLYNMQFECYIVIEHTDSISEVNMTCHIMRGCSDSILSLP